MPEQMPNNRIFRGPDDTLITTLSRSEFVNALANESDDPVDFKYIMKQAGITDLHEGQNLVLYRDDKKLLLFAGSKPEYSADGSVMIGQPNPSSLEQAMDLSPVLEKLSGNIGMSVRELNSLILEEMRGDEASSSMAQEPKRFFRRTPQETEEQSQTAGASPNKERQGAQFVTLKEPISMPNLYQYTHKEHTHMPEEIKQLQAAINLHISLQQFQNDTQPKPSLNNNANLPTISRDISGMTV